MDPEFIERDKKREREKIREELLAKLKEKYYLKPKSNKLETSDIIDSYKDQIMVKMGVSFKHNGYSQWESIKMSIRKVMCLHYGVYNLKSIPPEKYNDFRKDLENFMIDFFNLIRK